MAKNKKTMIQQTPHVNQATHKEEQQESNLLVTSAEELLQSNLNNSNIFGTV